MKPVPGATVRERGAVVEGPLPVDAGVEFVGETGHLGVAEVFAGKEDSFEQERGVDRGRSLCHARLPVARSTKW